MGGLQYLCVCEIVGLCNKGFKLLQRPKIMYRGIFNTVARDTYLQITPLFVFLLQKIEINILFMVTGVFLHVFVCKKEQFWMPHHRVIQEKYSSLCSC